MCPPAVKIASSLAFALPTGKTFADTGLADPDSPARANFEKDFKAQMAAKLGIDPKYIVVKAVGDGGRRRLQGDSGRRQLPETSGGQIQVDFDIGPGPPGPVKRRSRFPM